ncbi:MAG TPA: amino acid--tRNA ligase-related protein, partial [Flavobacterium sp.]
MALSEQEILRREALIELRGLGIEPYPANEFLVSAHSQDILENFEAYDGKEVILAGRMMSRRVMGKASFAEIKDSTGRLQVYVSRDDISNDEERTMYNVVFKKLLDIGDFIGVRGKVFKTQVGEVSVHIYELTVLAKALRPLPIVKTDADGKIHDAFADPEQRYRRRYVDLTVNDHVKETFIKRTKLFNSMRAFFNERGYLEVETPVLQPIPGGAAARPFITHHNSLDIPLYMRIANELYLKRLIVGGFEGVYEFSKNFRNEGMDRTHNPEFTAMEIYVAYKDYNWMMKFTENLLEHCATEVNGTTITSFGEHTVDFKAPYPRITMTDAIKQYTGF